MASFTITIDLDKKCAECRKAGATPSGICLKCCAKAVTGKRMKSLQGQAVQARIQQERSAAERTPSGENK